MSKAFIIEVHHRTAGIIAGNEGEFRFFSSRREFDRLDGQEFRSAREAERAATALVSGARHQPSSPPSFATLD